MVANDGPYPLLWSPALTAVTVTLAAVGAAMLVGSIVWRVALRPLEQMKERLAEERSQFEA
ncbi:MAG: hypothetical protein QOE08_549, partial [Thermoleophilaceae bacterium]|nr:hypothetical protein [Thermoleophilaceae bacterium]